MAILKPTPEAIEEAGRHLRAGGLVGAPTETVYGLFGDATSARAVGAIYDLKGRPRSSPLIVHVADIDMASELVTFDRRSRYLVQRNWPGPLTLVMKAREGTPVSSLATAGLDTIAIRVPDHPIALALIEAIGRPLAAPSANRYGALSPTEAHHVDAQFGRSLSMILDGGPTRIGVESTVLDLTGKQPVILRAGGVPLEVIEAAVGQVARADEASSVRSPGTAPSHYAPKLKVRLEALEPKGNEALIAFGPNPPEGFAETLNLSEAGDLKEAASNLFGFLYQLDRPDFSGIAVMPIPEKGIGIAINDRLRRAAAPRP
jgi:L-threonylcarbamoyladenylate synthase